MMKMANGQWAVLVCNEQNLPEKPVGSGYDYRLAGVVAGGRIVPKWCAIVS